MGYQTQLPSAHPINQELIKAAFADLDDTSGEEEEQEDEAETNTRILEYIHDGTVQNYSKPVQNKQIESPLANKASTHPFPSPVKGPPNNVSLQVTSTNSSSITSNVNSKFAVPVHPSSYFSPFNESSNRNVPSSPTTTATVPSPTSQSVSALIIPRLPKVSPIQIDLTGTTIIPSSALSLSSSATALGLPNNTLPPVTISQYSIQSGLTNLYAGLKAIEKTMSTVYNAPSGSSSVEVSCYSVSLCNLYNTLLGRIYVASSLIHKNLADDLSVRSTMVNYTYLLATLGSLVTDYFNRMANIIRDNESRKPLFTESAASTTDSTRALEMSNHNAKLIKSYIIRIKALFVWLYELPLVRRDLVETDSLPPDFHILPLIRPLIFLIRTVCSTNLSLNHKNTNSVETVLYYDPQLGESIQQLAKRLLDGWKNLPYVGTTTGGGTVKQ